MGKVQGIEAQPQNLILKPDMWQCFVFRTLVRVKWISGVHWPASLVPDPSVSKKQGGRILKNET